MNKLDIETKVFMLIFLLIAIDFAPLSFQDVFTYSQREPRKMVNNWLALNGKKNLRVMETSVKPYDYIHGLPTRTILEAGLSVPSNIIFHGTSKSNKYIKFFLIRVNEDLKRQRRLSEVSLLGCYLLNVGYVVIPPYYYDVKIDQFEQMVEFSERTRLGILPYHSPIILSKKIEKVNVKKSSVTAHAAESHTAKEQHELSAEKEVFRILQAMNIDMGANTSDKIFIADGLDEVIKTKKEPKLSLIGHTEKNQEVALTVMVNSDCFARLSYSYYPTLKIFVDGKETQIFKTAMNFIGLRLEPGKHKIVIKPSRSPLEKNTLFFSFGALLISLALIFKRKRGNCTIHISKKT